MAPVQATAPAETDELIHKTVLELARINLVGATGKPKVDKSGKIANWADHLPKSSLERFKKYNIDLSGGYPVIPKVENIPKFLDEAYAVRNEEYPYIERGKNADPEKKALFGAAKEVRHLTKHIGTEIIGLQLSDLNDKQKDELALLVAERVVVFFKNQDLSPHKQLELGKYWGQVEIHPQATRVPNDTEGNDLNGITSIWLDYFIANYGLPLTFRKAKNYGTSRWHTDLVHEFQPAGLTHLHLDAIPDVGGDTYWASGYAAFDKLSPAFQKFLEGKKAVYTSAHAYLDRNDPLSGPKHIEREHPIIRTHPATGWKSLFVNRSMTKRIVGLEPEESDVILEYLFNIFEKNSDIQVRFNWSTEEGKGTSAIWDNRISQHSAVWDHEGREERHGTRVTSLAEVPFFDPESKSQREALGLPLN